MKEKTVILIKVGSRQLAGIEQGQIEWLRGMLRNAFLDELVQRY